MSSNAPGGPLEEWREALHAEESPEEERALWLLSLLEWRAGNWELAARHAADLLELRAQFGREGDQAGLGVARGADRRAPRSDRGGSRSVGARAGARGGAWPSRRAVGPSLGPRLHRALARRAGEALEYLEPAWEIRDGLRQREPGFQWELADTLEALIAVGELEQAETRLVSCRGASARARPLLGARDHRPLPGAPAVPREAISPAPRRGFERSLAEHARTQDPFQHARTLLAFGATQRRAKQRGAARATLEQALAIFERFGAPLWAEQAHAELQRIGGRAPSRGELTEAEHRIAALVVEGRTNREVASALFVTEHTVERALTRAYRKLGVRSRTELAHRLRRES